MVFEGDELEIMRKVIHESEWSDSESGLIDWGKIDRQYEEQRRVTPGLSYQDFLKTVPELVADIEELKKYENCTSDSDSDSDI